MYSRKILSECDLEFAGFTDFVLGDSSEIEDITYNGFIVFFNEMIQVRMVTTTDEEALIGMKLLQGKIITINAKNNTILITK